MSSMRKIATLGGLCVLGASLLPAQSSYSFSYQGLPLKIFNDASDIISVANIFVPVAVKMTNVTVRVQVSYPQVGDLQLYLYSPEGTRTILLENDCGSLLNVDTTFDDSAASAYKDFCPTEAGRGPFQADQPLSNFYSDDSSYGVWWLAVQNTESDSRSGWLNTLTLNITGNNLTSPLIGPQTIVNSASNIAGGFGFVSPGELVSVYGVLIGSATSVQAPSGNLPTSLGGTTVTVNGTAVPIAYASQFRADVQIPQGLAWGSDAVFQVGYNGMTTPTVTLEVASTGPGIYTLQSGGGGPIKAINQDGSLNGILHPAPAGTYIALYASGLGATTPSVAAGTITPSDQLYPTNQPVTASIGGVPCTVLYAGLAPGYVGLYQVNVMLGSTVPSGTRNVVISVGGNSSPLGSTIVVQ